MGSNEELISNQVKHGLQKFIECCSETYFYNLLKSSEVSDLDNGEQTLVSLEMARLVHSKVTEIENFNKLDTVTKELSLPYGRADIAIFHIDGSASVIEAKDGKKGYSHVVKGIGQVSLYASQLANRRVNISKVSRYLMWSSVEDDATNDAIYDACVFAGVIPMQREPIRESIARSICAIKNDSNFVSELIAAREEYIKNYIQFTHELEACVGNLHHDRAKIS